MGGEHQSHEAKADSRRGGDRSGHRSAPARQEVTPWLALQDQIGNRAALRYLQAKLRVGATAGPPEGVVNRAAEHVTRSHVGPILQRKCACGGPAGECEECRETAQFSLQAKLRINDPGDAFEREADRVADQVLETSARAAVGAAPPRIQRFAGAPGGPAEVPESVGRALAGPGQALGPALRRDMEERFGADFSGVRVHTGPAAERSALDVGALAYTVGRDIVFGPGRFAPASDEGRRLIAHELTHTIQQSGADGLRAGRGDAKGGPSPARVPSGAPPALQRKPDARSLDEEADDFDEDDYPGYDWQLVAKIPNVGRPDFIHVRAVLGENTGIGRDLLAETDSHYHYRNAVWVGSIRPSYYSFVQSRSHKVVARAFAFPEGFHPQRMPSPKEILTERFVYDFYAFLPHSEGAERYAFPLPLASAKPPPAGPPTPPAGPPTSPAGPAAPAAPELAARVTGKWVELHQGVYAFLPDEGITLDMIAAYLTGHPDVPEMLSKLNGYSRTAVIPKAQPIIVPIEFIDRQKAFEEMPEDVRRSIILTNQARVQNEQYRRFIDYRSGHPMGPGTVGLIPVTTEVLKQVGIGVLHLSEKLKYGVAFAVGLIHGFLKSIWDTVYGVGKLVYDFAESLITGEIVSDAKELAGAIKDLSVEQIKNALGDWADRWAKELDSNDPFTAGHAHGYLTGYVVAEALMFLLSFGETEALKGALWASDLGRAVKESRLWMDLSEAAEKASVIRRAAGGKFAEAVDIVRKSRFGAVIRGAEVAGTAVSWTARSVTTVLKLPGRFAGYIADKVVAHVKQLEPFFERIGDLSERAKLWLFGCHSPCNWEAVGVARKMAGLTDDQIERLAASRASEVVAEARLRVAETETSLAATRRGREAAELEVRRAEENLETARLWVAEEGGTALMTEAKTELKRARRALERVEKDYELARTHANIATRAAEQIEPLEMEIAQLDRDIQAIYRKNGNVRPSTSSPDGKALRILEGERNKLADEMEKRVGSLSEDWIKQLRRGTPGKDAVERAVQNLGDLPEELRVGGKPVDIIDPAGGELKEISPDHIYPVDKIVREPGFGQLSPAQQREVLELKENYLPMRLEANQSKGALTMDEWFETETGRKVPQKLRKALREAETLAQDAVRKYIANPPKR